jgi:hypothetical protein
MKRKESEFEKFDETMEKLLSVPYSELQKKLADEKKKKEKKRTKRPTSSRVSSKAVSG